MLSQRFAYVLRISVFSEVCVLGADGAGVGMMDGSMGLPEQRAMDEALRAIGFFGIENHFDRLCARAMRMSIEAGSTVPGNGFNHYEAFPSFIPMADATRSCPYVLTIDIGGTNTRVGLRVTQAGQVDWYHVLEDRNDEFEEHAGEVEGNSFEKYARLLCRKIARSLEALGIPLVQVSACGVVWSNALSNRQVEYGVTGFVEQRELYRKGEWFVADISDGTDLGAVFRTALLEAGIQVKRLIVSNDTPFTLTATSGADAGMVASTGLNGTIAKSFRELNLSESDDLVVCNAEIGGRMLIEKEFLSQADLIGAGGRCTVEFLTSGKFLPIVFLSTLEYLAEHGVNEFRDVVDFLNSHGDEKIRVFRSRHISALLEDDRERLKEERPEVFNFPEALPLLGALALRIVERSARLCAMVAFATVANRFDTRTSFRVALDSRLARAISFFRELLQDTLETITPEGKSIEVELLHGLDGIGGRITVPMQGAANALDRIC